jgi:RNA polymerase primary sigma factor
VAKSTEDGKKRGFLSSLLHPGQNKSSGEPTKKEATIIPAAPKAAKPKADAAPKSTVKSAPKTETKAKAVATKTEPKAKPAAVKAEPKAKAPAAKAKVAAKLEVEVAVEAKPVKAAPKAAKSAAPAATKAKPAKAKKAPKLGDDDDVEIDDVDDLVSVEEIVAEAASAIDLTAVEDHHDDEHDEDEKEKIVVPEGALVLSNREEDDIPVQTTTITGATADPVKDYLKQIGKVALLNAELEVELAKRIEAGLFAEEKLATDTKLTREAERDLKWVVKDGQRAKSFWKPTFAL